MMEESGHPKNQNAVVQPLLTGLFLLNNSFDARRHKARYRLESNYLL